MRWINFGLIIILSFQSTLLFSGPTGPPQPHLKSIRIVFLGDSLTEGYGVQKEQAYPMLIEKKLKSSGYPNIEIVNAGISGSTSASAESRLKWHLQSQPQIVVIALGANDGLRGIRVEETRKNLEKAISLAQAHQIQVLLAGMRLPPNYGKSYTQAFHKMFAEVAKKYHVLLIPFLLKGVAGVRELNQEDAIHPNAKGQELIAAEVEPYLKKLISKVEEMHPR